MALQENIATFVDHYLTAKGDRPETLRWYRIRLKQFRCWVEKRENADIEDAGLLDAYVSFLYARGLKQSTVNGHIRALRAFYKYLVARDIVRHNAAGGLRQKKDLGRVPRAISLEARRLILDTAYKSENRRDYALLLFLADSGARAGEVCSMTLDALELDRLEAVVEGKRGQRVVVFSEASCEATQEYIDWERETDLARLIGLGLVEQGSEASRRLWLGRQGPLTYWGVRMLLRRVVDEARNGLDSTLVEDGPTNAHSFRHAFARDILQEGGSLTEVRDQLGHGDIQTSQMYSCWRVGERHQLHAAHSVVGREARRRAGM